MPNINDLLEFHFSSANFQENATKNIIPITLAQSCDLKINKLNRIVEKIGICEFKLSKNNLIPQIFKKFKSYLSNKKIEFERRELRTLSYTFTYSNEEFPTIFSSANELNIALQLLNSNWRDSFLLGIFNCYLNNWDAKNKASLLILEKFINEKLNAYNDEKKTIKSLKQNQNYFNLKNGDLLLGSDLALKDIPIQKTTKFLSLPDSWFKYPYFSKVIIAYYEKKRENELVYVLNDFESALDIHYNSTSSKKLISKLIIHTNNAEYINLQDKVKQLAFKFIGDPDHSSKWTLINATNKEKEELAKAKVILNEWITRQFIDVFFNVCINDKERKIFWLKFASKISSFKVFGPSSRKKSLSKDERVADYINTRFTTVNSKEDVSAFILYIGEYMIIEFSENGFACCAYKMSSKNKPNLKKIQKSVKELRNPSLPLAIQSDGDLYITNEEGRLLHQPNWEHKFNYWLTEKVL